MAKECGGLELFVEWLIRNDYQFEVRESSTIIRIWERGREGRRTESLCIMAGGLVGTINWDETNPDFIHRVMCAWRRCYREV